MPTCSVDGETLAYETRGSGWPLLFLHGGWVDRDLWAPQVERFASDLEVVTPDLRGHGESTHEDVSVDRMANDVAALCDDLGLERPVVCGLSLGGLVAQRFALEHPDRAAGLVLADTVRSVPPVPGTPASRRLLSPTAPAHVMTRLWGAGAYFRGLLAGVESTQGPWLALDDEAREYALDCVDAYDAGEFVEVLEAFHAHEMRDLSALSVPTLVVHGDREPAPVRSQNRTMTRAIPDATREVLDDAGHLANRDAPTAFGDALDSFLDERVTVSA
jgi:pimeloyl-ACP methyl ester carboxylesterase